MGVKGLAKWIAHTFPRTRVTTAAKNVAQFDHVCFDLNCILHEMHPASAQNPDTCLQLFERSLATMLNSFPASKSTFLAFDGPGPFAKVALQKQRRWGGDMQAVYVTPGTTFMLNAQDRCQSLIQQMLASNHMNRTKYVISGTDIPDEGELKIMRYLKQVTINDDRDPATTNTFISTCDSDALLLAISCPVNTQLKISLQTQHTERRYIQFFDMDTFFSKYIDRRFPGQRDVIRRDLTLLILLCGNEYLPKIPELSINRLWSIYQKLKNSTKFCNRSLVIATQTEASDSVNDQSLSGIDLEFLYEILSRHERNKEFDQLLDACTVPLSVSDYLRGVLWNLDMYANARCRDFSFIPPTFPPLIGHVLREIESNSEALNEQLQQLPKSSVQPLLPAVLCMAVLPPSPLAVQFVPQQLQRFLAPGSELYDAFYSSYQQTQPVATAAEYTLEAKIKRRNKPICIGSRLTKDEYCTFSDPHSEHTQMLTTSVLAALNDGDLDPRLTRFGSSVVLCNE